MVKITEPLLSVYVGIVSMRQFQRIPTTNDVEKKIKKAIFFN